MGLFNWHVDYWDANTRRLKRPVTPEYFFLFSVHGSPPKTDQSVVGRKNAAGFVIL